jgi:tetratricopeptide (TPR) repeat protein
MNPTPRRAETMQAGPASRRASPSAQDVFAEAFRHHRAGHLDEADRLYRQVLTSNARHCDSLHLLGVVAYQRGQDDTAVDLIGRAIAINARDPSYHSNLGNALRRQRRLNEAAASCSRAIALKPDLFEPHHNLGATLIEQGRLEEAVDSFRRALDLNPDYRESHVNLATALKALGRLDEAAACYRRMLALEPDDFAAHVNLGIVLTDQGRPDEAALCFGKALELKPDCAEAFSNLGAARAQQGRLDEGVACYRRAVSLRPDCAAAHSFLGMALLAQGHMVPGWEEYEWRWKTPHLAAACRNFPQPQWRGEPMAGRTLLIHAEQGYGDTLQFCRYAPVAAARGLRVILEVPKPLVRLLRSLPGVDHVVQQGKNLPPFDVHCPTLSMPLALETTIATIPCAVPYLQADAEQVAAWRTRLAAMDNQNPRIGLVWAGNPRTHSPELAAVDRRRSLAPERLAPLFDVSGLHFFSLQKGGPKAPANFPLTDFMDEMTDFADTAALIANLDLVISVDSAVAHLAAALGKQVWLLDRFDSCWRWLRGRRDSPWYPTLLLYRQTHPGDWTPVLAEIAANLRGLVAACPRR